MGACPEGLEDLETANVTVLGGLERAFVVGGLRAHGTYAGIIVAVNDRGSSDSTYFNITTPSKGESSDIMSCFWTLHGRCALYRVHLNFFAP